MLSDPRLSGVEVLQAHYLRYRYAPHWHEAVCVAVVGAGAEAANAKAFGHRQRAGRP
jgi:hypothetical protein